MVGSSEIFSLAASDIAAPFIFIESIFGCDFMVGQTNINNGDEPSGRVVSPSTPQVYNPRRPRFFQNLVTVTTSALPLFYSLGVVAPRLVRTLSIEVYDIGTATTVYVGSKEGQYAKLLNTGDAKAFDVSGAIFDANEIFVKCDNGNSTLLVIEGFEV